MDWVSVPGSGLAGLPAWVLSLEGPSVAGAPVPLYSLGSLAGLVLVALALLVGDPADTQGEPARRGGLRLAAGVAGVVLLLAGLALAFASRGAS